ncbi:MAG: hypothetical protein SFZ03_10900 [Candidatus Melainabacteria bacterium]|nr:hypothetical protein [Candidatus Melainabacteria bacterium]
MGGIRTLFDVTLFSFLIVSVMAIYALAQQDQAGRLDGDWLAGVWLQWLPQPQPAPVVAMHLPAKRMVSSVQWLPTTVIQTVVAP